MMFMLPDFQQVARGRIIRLRLSSGPELCLSIAKRRRPYGKS